jgi:hypothetical protein
MENQNLVEDVHEKNVEFDHYYLLLQRRMVVEDNVEHQCDVQQELDEEIMQLDEIMEFQEENQMLVERMESNLEKKKYFENF